MRILCSYLFLMCCIGSASLYSNAPLEIEIASKDLALKNQQEFEEKLNSLISVAKSTLAKPLTENNKRYASQIHTQLSVLLDIYGHRYPIEPSLRKEIVNLLTKPSDTAPTKKESPIKATEVSIPALGLTYHPGFKLPFIKQSPGQILTQTQVYLQVPELRSRAYSLIRSLEQEHGTEAIAPYLSLIPDIIRQEVALKDYDVFYHGQHGDFAFLYDVIKEIQQWLAVRQETKHFEYLRTPGMFHLDQSLKEFLKATFSEDQSAFSQGSFDKTHQDLLLSVNLSLFGSSDASNESSFAYFVAGYNAYTSSTRPLLEKLFDHFDFKKSYLDELLALSEKFRKGAEKGNLLQIFMPRDKVNDLVYLSGGFGGLPVGVKPSYFHPLDFPRYAQAHPIKVKDDAGKIRTYNLKTMDTRTYLDFYRSNPQAINPDDMDVIQGRILLNNDFLTYSREGIKIYSYNFITINHVEQYKKEFKRIISRMMLDWLTSPTDTFLKERYHIVQKAFKKYTPASKVGITITPKQENKHPLVNEQQQARDFWKKYFALQKARRKKFQTPIPSRRPYAKGEKDVMTVRWALDQFLTASDKRERLDAYNALRELFNLELAVAPIEIDTEWVSNENRQSLIQIMKNNLALNESSVEKKVYLLNSIFEPECFGEDYLHLFKSTSERSTILDEMRLIAYNELRSMLHQSTALSTNDIDEAWLDHQDTTLFKYIVNTHLVQSLNTSPKQQYFLTALALGDVYPLSHLLENSTYDLCFSEEREERIRFNAYNLLRQMLNLAVAPSPFHMDKTWLENIHGKLNDVFHSTKKGRQFLDSLTESFFG